MAESLLQGRIRSGLPFNELLGEFLGKPFQIGASGPKAYDCYGLCRAFMHRMGVDLPDLGATSIEQAPNLCQQAAPQFIRLDWPRPWSLLSLRRSGELATHCGIVLPYDGLFLHAQEKSGVVAEPITHRYWNPRIEGYYWPKGVVEMVVMHSPIGPDHSWAFFRAGYSLAQMLDVKAAEQIQLRVFIDGKEVERGAWETTFPTELQQIVIRPQYGDGRQGLMIFGMVMLMIVGGWVAGPAVMGLQGASYSLFMAGVMVAGSYMMNALIPPPKPYEEKGGSYGWNPQTTQREGVPIPRVYGKCPVKGNIFMSYGSVSNTSGYYESTAWTVFGGPYGPYVMMPITSDHPTTAASDYSWNLKLAYGDGPVKGIVWGSEKINGQPLSAYTGLSVQHKPGTDIQTATTMGDRTHYEPRLRGYYAVPVTYTFPDADVDKLVVIIGLPAGLIHYDDDGDAAHRSVGIKIEIREVGSGEAGWQTLVNTQENSKTTKWIHFAYASDGTYAGGSPVTITHGHQYEVRFTRTTDNGGSMSKDETWLEAVQGVYNDAFKYPGLAYTAISALASAQLNTSLDWEAVIEGRILPVYNGAAWTLQYSNNPAWVMVDLLTRPVIKGDGAGTPYSVEYYRGLDISWIDAAAFKTLADYCDEMVDDGNGGTEKRFTFNGILENEQEAWQAVLMVADMCRAFPYFNGRQVTVCIDKAATPVQAFTVGNIVRGSFDETWFDEADRVSEINYTILDEKQDFRRTPIRIVDTKVSRRAPVSIEGWGITSRSQAYRTAIHKLTINRLMPRSIEFPADLDAIYCKVGDVIYVQHPVMKINQGGRVTAVDGIKITVDFTPADDGVSTYQIVLRTLDETDGEKLQLYTVASTSGKDITISLPDWVYIPQVNDVLVYGKSTTINDLYRVRTIRRTQDCEVTLFCTAYDEAYYGPDAMTPVVATLQAVTAAAADRALHMRPPSDEDLDNRVPQSQVAQPTLSGTPRLASMAFSGNGVDTVTWTGSDIDNHGTVVYNGQVVWIKQDLTGTTDKYIYFDPNAEDPRSLQHTNDRNSLVGQEKYVVCVNINGVAYPQPCVRLGYNATLIGVEEGATNGATWNVNIAGQPAGYLIVWKGTLTEAPANPENGWAYYNSTDGKSYIYHDNAWYQMSVDGVSGDGSGFVWKGESATPPADPEINWAYRDTDDGIVYIWNGSAWEVLVQDGSEGSSGLSVFVTYHDNAADNPPAAPTGDGTTGGWHTDATSSVVWISQKVAADVLSGSWSTPLRISGTAQWSEVIDDDGNKPEDGADVTGDHGGDIPIDDLPLGSMFRKEVSETCEDTLGNFASRWQGQNPDLEDEAALVEGGVFGGKCFQVGDNSGNDCGAFIFAHSIPFDPNKLYRLTICVKRTAGEGTFCAGVLGRDATDTQWVGYDGTNSPSYLKAYNCAADLHTPTGDWLVYTGYFKGTAATGTHGEATNRNFPGKLHSNVRYVRPYFLVNAPDVPGTMQVDSIELDILDPPGIVLPLGVTDGGTGATDASGARENLGAQQHSGPLDDVVNVTNTAPIGTLFYVTADGYGVRKLQRLPQGVYGQVLTSIGANKPPIWDWAWGAAGAMADTKRQIILETESLWTTDKVHPDRFMTKTVDIVASEGFPLNQKLQQPAVATIPTLAKETPDHTLDKVPEVTLTYTTSVR